MFFISTPRSDDKRSNNRTHHAFRAACGVLVEVPADEQPQYLAVGEMSFCKLLQKNVRHSRGIILRGGFGHLGTWRHVVGCSFAESLIRNTPFYVYTHI